MSHEIPVFTFSIAPSAIQGREIGLAEALTLVPPEHWLSTSRNWWYQGLMAKVLTAYPGFEALRYLTEIVAVVVPEQLAERANLIRSLIRSIGENTEPFVMLNIWAGTPREVVQQEIEEVRTNIGQAVVARAFNDDCIYAYGNFFSFLVSQAAALEEASLTGSFLVYVQPQP